MSDEKTDKPTYDGEIDYTATCVRCGADVEAKIRNTGGLSLEEASALDPRPIIYLFGRCACGGGVAEHLPHLAPTVKAPEGIH